MIELDKIIPVNPPIVNISKKPVDHKIIGEFILYPLIVIIHLKILIPVGYTLTKNDKHTPIQCFNHCSGKNRSSVNYARILKQYVWS